MPGRHFFRPRRAVRPHRGLAAEEEPIDVELRLPVDDQQHHLFVVSQQGDEPALPLQLQQPIEHLAGLRAAIDVIAHRHQRIVRPEPDGPQQRIQRGEAAVDVSDGNGAGHGLEIGFQRAENPIIICLAALHNARGNAHLIEGGCIG